MPTEIHEQDIVADASGKTDVQGLLQRRRAIVNNVRRYMHRTFDELHAASRSQTDELRMAIVQLEQKPADDLTAEEIKGWEDAWTGFYSPAMQSAHKLYHEELMDKLLRGYNETPRIISTESITEWSNRFKKESVHYKDRERFIRETLPRWIDNWRRVAQERAAQMKNPAFASVTTAQVPDLAKFKDENVFLNLKFPARENLVGLVKSAIIACGSGRTALHAKAMAMLYGAVNDGYLSPSKVGVWMQRIFESGAKPELIEQFIRGEGSNPLRELIRKWGDVRARFDKIEDRRSKEGSPASFSFVKEYVFLDWHYERRKAYVEEAERRFTDPSVEKYDFLRIRHALDVKDWADADALIGDVKSKALQRPLSSEDASKLQSMEKYLHENRGKKQSSKENPSSDEIRKKMHAALALIPTRANVIKHIAEEILHTNDPDAIRAFGSTIYNRWWCWQRGHLNEKKELYWRKRSKSDTYEHFEHGQPTKLANNNIAADTSKRPAIRTSNQTRSPQLLHLSSAENENDTVMLSREIYNNKNNRSFWYWTSIIVENVPIEDYIFIVRNVFPVLKWGMRTLKARDDTFTIGATNRSDAAEVQYSSIA